MTHPLVTTIAAFVNDGNIDNAERALVAVADAEGDQALALIIEDMSARDLVAILREHDSSRPSMISELISPKQFVAAVVMERNYRERTHESLRGIINAVLFRDDADPDDYIEALGGNPDGVEALVNYFSDRHSELEFFFRNGTYVDQDGSHFGDIPAGDDDLFDGEFDETHRRGFVRGSEVMDGDWKELGWRLWSDHYEIFREVMELLRKRHREALAEQMAPAKAAPLPGLDDDDEDDVL